MDEIVIRRTHARPGRRYDLLESGNRIGEFTARAVAPGTFRADDHDLRLTTAGVLLPRHVARHADDGTVVGTLTQGPLPGRLHLALAGGPVARAGARGILRPTLRVPADDAALEYRPAGLIGPAGRARLTPSATWPRGHILVALALILHARVRSHALVA